MKNISLILCMVIFLVVKSNSQELKSTPIPNKHLEVNENSLGLGLKVSHQININYTQTICSTIGQDSTALYNNGYITGPQNKNCGQNIHTESKWIKITGADSLYINTFQHRLYDFSKVYDQNNNLIWTWLGENASATWYFKSHSIFVGGNDSVRIEFHQGFSDPFCNGYLQVVGMHCSNLTSNINHIIKAVNFRIYPNPSNGKFIIDNGDIQKMNGYSIKIINSLGQQVYQGGITQQIVSIDITQWTGNGMYYLQLTDNNGNIVDVKKIVLQ